MDIIYHGNTCFTCKGKTGAIVINPDKSIKSQLKGDVVASSIGADLAEVQGTKKVFDWPGEYEVSEISIFGMNAWTRSRSKEEEEGSKGEKTIIFDIELDGIRLCHLGGLGHKLTVEMVDEIGDVDVLFVPTGDNSNLKGKVEEIVEQIDPRVVIIMGEGDIEKGAKELNAQLEHLDKEFSIKSRSDLPEDKTRYIVLSKV